MSSYQERQLPCGLDLQSSCLETGPLRPVIQEHRPSTVDNFRSGLVLYGISLDLWCQRFSHGNSRSAKWSYCTIVHWSTQNKNHTLEHSPVQRTQFYKSNLNLRPTRTRIRRPTGTRSAPSFLLSFKQDFSLTLLFESGCPLARNIRDIEISDFAYAALPPLVESHQSKLSISWLVERRSKGQFNRHDLHWTKHSG